MSDGNLLTREDTFFGVCEGLGEDLGIHSNLIRLTFAGLLFWNPLGAIAGYVSIGLLVAALRWMVPNPRAASVEAPAPASGDESAPALETSAAEQDRLPMAA